MPAPSSLEPHTQVEGCRRGSLPTVLPLRRHCLVPWAGKPHHSLVRSLSWEAHPDTTVTPDTQPCASHPIQRHPGSLARQLPALQPQPAADWGFPGSQPCLTSREASVTVPSACHGGVQINIFLWKQIEIFLGTIFFCQKCNALSCQQHKALLKMHNP